MRRSRMLPGLLLLSVPPAAQGQLWHVAMDGSGDFEGLQEAIDAAADGDTLLLAPGSHFPAVVDGKGLVLQASEPPVIVWGDLVTFAPALEISLLASAD